MDSEVLNLEQAVELFGVSERTMIKLLKEERVPARKIGREWRFSRSSLLKWLGEGDSINYLNQAEQAYQVAEDTSATVAELLSQVVLSLDQLYASDYNIRKLLPNLEGDVFLPGEATLQISYERQRETETLTYKIFWPSSH